MALSEPPDLGRVPKQLRDKVAWNERDRTLTISSPLTEAEAGRLGEAVVSATARETVMQTAEKSRTDAIDFLQTPAEKGERFAVRQLALRVQGELMLFDDPDVL